MFQNNLLHNSILNFLVFILLSPNIKKFRFPDQRMFDAFSGLITLNAEDFVKKN